MAYRSPARVQHYTNYYAEEKEKEMLVRQLTAQLEALKLNHKDFIILQSQAQLMNDKYGALQLEKDKVTESIRHKTQLMDKHLAEQGRELLRLRAELAETRSQLESTLGQKELLATQLSNRAAQIEALKK